MNLTNSAMGRNRAIPDRWIPYKACGKIIEGTRFICFKVPLKKNVQIGNPEIKEIWDINTLLEKIPGLRSVIDLTNTHRYYDPLELQKLGVCHRKILMPGRVIPPEKTVRQFMEAVEELLRKDSHSLIGVHCTHGLNRTGYMVCRYMRDRLGLPGKEAIKRFQLARGYKIERDNYIADLIGKKPPPPDVGRPTKLKPINPGESDNEKKSRKTKTKSDSVDNYRERGHGSDEYRDSHRDRKVSNSSEDSRKSRKYSDDSDRTNSSYDFKYDY